MKTYYLGFDLGIQARNPTGAALLSWDTGEPILVSTWILIPAGADWQKRVSVVADQARLILHISAGQLAGVGYELPWQGVNPQTALRLADLGGAIRGLACSFQVPVVGLSPAEAKIALTGEKGANKEAMQRAALLQFGCVLTSHEADAVGVALSARAILHRAALVEEMSK